MLRKALPEDIDFIYGLYMHPSVNPWLLYEQMSKKDFTGVYTDLLNRNVKHIFCVNGMNAGMVKLIPSGFRTSHIVYIGGLAIHPDLNGRGYGKQLLQETIAYCRAGGFHRLELSVASFNQKAIRLYEEAGFEKEGILKDYTWLAAENKYIDEVMMALLINQ